MMLPDFLVRTSFFPESSVEARIQSPSRLLDLFSISVTVVWRFELTAGPIVFGIREVSENREFESRYTLIEHASWDTLNRKSCLCFDSSSEVRDAAEIGDTRRS